MAAAETARLIASLDLKDNLSKGIKSATTSISGLESRLGRIGGIAQQGVSSAIGNIAKLGLVAGAGIGAAIKTGLDDLAELENAVTSVEGAISQLGLAGQLSGRQVAQWANEIEAATGAAFDDKAIVQATTTLLRFGKVTPDNLRPTLEVMTDLATKTGSIDSAAVLLAKALAEPEKAAGKLARAGVVLTKQQQAQIKEMVKGGDAAGAQAFLLDRLAESTKGAALASQGPYQRALSVLADVSEDARKALAEGFLPVLEKLAGKLSKGLADPKVMAQIREFGQGLAGSLDSLIAVAERLPWATIGDSLRIAGAGAKTVLQAFTSLPPWVQTAVITGWGLNKLTGGALGGIVSELGKGLIKGVLGMNAGVVNINAGAVNGGGLPGAAGAKGGLGLASKVFLIGEAIGLAVLVNEVRNGIAEGNTQTSEALVKQTREWLAQNPSKDELKNGLGGVEDAIKNLASSNLPLTLVQGESLDNLRHIRQLILNQLAIDNSPDARQSRADLHKMAQAALEEHRRGERGLERLTATESAITAMHHALHDDLQAAIDVIETSNDPDAIAAAIATAVTSVRGGAGSAGTTGALVDDLKAQLKAAEAANNPDLAAKIKAAIAQIEPFQKGRQWQAEQIAKAREIVSSNKTTAEKVAALKSIQSDLLSHQRTMAAGIVSGLAAVVSAVKAIRLPAGQTPKVNDSTGFTTGGTPLPRPTPKTVNDSTGFVLTANVTLSTRDVKTAQEIRSRMGATPVEAGSA